MNIHVNFRNTPFYSLSILIIFSTFLSASVQAERAYVSDALTIPIRSGHSIQHRIKKYLNSGTVLEVVELSEDKEWSHVTAAGSDGWVRNQYIQNAPTAKLQLISAKNQLVRLKETTQNQNLRLKTLSSELNTLQKQHSKLSKNHDSTEEEFSDLKQLSANAIRIDRANSALIKDNQLMKVDMEQLKAERDKYKSDNFNKGLQLGAGILIIGILVGFIMKSKGRKQTNSW
ncbi:MAG: TIGR04211 family SH3 domain-containing protein [Pseudomonadales bacterium]|nr:TIGR04211 family SH3 domain-containing protein [Pseudomonadales bacterium]